MQTTNRPYLDETGNLIFPAGTYYVGDPCYVISDLRWSALCDATKCFEKQTAGCPNTFLVEDVTMFAAPTSHGDGTYKDSDGRTYSVDSGLIGIVPMEAVLADSEYRKGEYDEGSDLGHILTFDYDFQVYVDDEHKFHFGKISIETDIGVEDDYYPDDSEDEYRDYIGY